MSTLDGRQRVREVITLALQEDYKGASAIVDDLAKDGDSARGAMIYLVHLVLALGMVAVKKNEEDLQAVLQHVFTVSAADEIEAMGL